MNQRGFAPLLLIVFALIIVAVIITAAYFIFKGEDKSNQKNSTTVSEDGRIPDEVLPYKICPSGDPEYCEDTIPENATDNLTIEEGS